MSAFFQDPPTLENTYQENRWLKMYLSHKLPKQMFAEVDLDLNQLGKKCAKEYLELARTAEREKPVHIPYTPWGERRDEIRLSHAWHELQDISAREGMVAIAYERKFSEYSRLYQFAKLYLFHPSSAFFTCPLAMADGAAKVLETYGESDSHKAAFRHLTSRDPKQFWTSGQWMTERTGGSDVSGTSTEARSEGNKIRLYGTKWFSSATTSAMALALAKLPASKSLTLFMVETYSKPGILNHIQVNRLKDKLGTWALPTAELTLQGTVAEQVGPRDQGVKTVASMLNITRLYNSICSVGQSTRGFDLLRNYSSKRKVFGHALSDQVLHYTTFAEEELKNLAGFLLTFELVHLLGKEECKTLKPNEAEILRLMTPVCKLFTARSAIQSASEVIEGFGGAGYIEDSGIPVQLRDSQVFPIWEGATNVLSLDMLRAAQKTDALATLKADIESRLKNAHEFVGPLEIWATLSSEVQLASSRSFAFYLARLYSYSLLMSWLEKETEPNQIRLRPWAEHFAKRYLGSWQPTQEEETRRLHEMWTSPKV